MPTPTPPFVPDPARKPAAGGRERGQACRLRPRTMLLAMICGTHQGLAAIADLWLPRTCAGCSQTLGRAERGFCTGCIVAAPGVTSARCACCALPTGDDRPQAMCVRCRAGAPPYDATLTWADYAAPIDRIVSTMKFRRQWALANALAEAMAVALADAARTQQPDVVSWIPLGRSRLRDRGFNQAQVLATRFALRVGWPRPRPLLQRVRETSAQSGTAGADRWSNVAGAFSAIGRLEGKHVALVDDVMTTGATAAAGAEALKRAGAATVTLVVAARTPLPGPG